MSINILQTLPKPLTELIVDLPSITELTRLVRTRRVLYDGNNIVVNPRRERTINYRYDETTGCLLRQFNMHPAAGEWHSTPAQKLILRRLYNRPQTLDYLTKSIDSDIEEDIEILIDKGYVVARDDGYYVRIVKGQPWREDMIGK